MEEKILEVKNLKVSFKTDFGKVQAVRGVSFDLNRGEVLCIVGESGSGKSVTSKTIMGILANNAIIEGGSIMYSGEDLIKVSEEEFHRIRGHKIGMIFQDPLSSLNPIVKIGKQITEAILLNSDRLKQKYNDIIAPELVAYKNSIAELNHSLDMVDQKLNNFISNEFKSLKDTEKKISDCKEKIEFYKSEKSHKVNDPAAQSEYDEKIKSLLAEVDSLKAEAQSFDKTKANKSVADAKKKASKEKTELKAKYKKIIAEKKSILKAKQKVAKQEVKAYKASITDKYNKDLAVLNEAEKSASSKEELDAIKVKKEELKKDYIKSLKVTKKEAKEMAIKVMTEVGIPMPEKRFKQYPFEFSGGMRQRIVIAIALTANPEILICDEPTTALDVTIQAQILELINKLKRERNLSCIFITHDLGVVANMADRVAVMYAGRIVEYGKVDEIFYEPKHPYTWALLSSIPDVDSKEKLDAIPGTPPNMVYPPKGDAFALRSKYAMKIDFEKEPPYFKVSDTHYAATWLLHPDAPHVEMPAIVKARIEKSLKGGKE